MPDIKAKVLTINQTKDKTIFTLAKGRTVLGAGANFGKTNILCGKCGSRLMETIKRGAFVDVVLQCPECGSFNEIPK